MERLSRKAKCIAGRMHRMFRAGQVPAMHFAFRDSRSMNHFRSARRVVASKALLVVIATTLTIVARAAAPSLEGMDASVVPGNDFFAYANGTWLKNTEIPADRSTYGSGAILTELNAQR